MQREVKIEFYAIITQDGSVWDASLGIDAVRTLDRGDRYMTVDQRSLCLYPPKAGNQRGQLCWVHFDERPPVDIEGELTDLDLPENAGLADQALFVVFDNTYIGVIRTLHAPGISRLAEYFTTKLPHLGLPAVSLDSLVSPQAAKKLQAATELRKVTLRVQPSAIDQMAAVVPTYKHTLDGAAQIDSDATDVEITLSTRKAAGRSASLLNNIRRLSRRDDLAHLANGFHVRIRTEDGDLENINVLDERLIKSANVDVIVAGKRLDEESAYRAIRAAYESLKDDLEAAASISTV